MRPEDVRVGMWLIDNGGDACQAVSIEGHGVKCRYENHAIGTPIHRLPDDTFIRPLTLGDLKEGDRFTSEHAFDDPEYVAVFEKWMLGPHGLSDPRGLIPAGEMPVSLVLDDDDPTVRHCAECGGDITGNGFAFQVNITGADPYVSPLDYCNTKCVSRARVRKVKAATGPDLPAVGSRWTLPKCPELSRPVHYEVTAHDVSWRELHCVEILSARTFDVPVRMHCDLAVPFVDPYTGATQKTGPESGCGIRLRSLPNPNAPRPEPVAYWSGEYADEGGA